MATATKVNPSEAGATGDSGEKAKKGPKPKVAFDWSAGTNAAPGLSSGCSI